MWLWLRRSSIGLKNKWGNCISAFRERKSSKAALVDYPIMVRMGKAEREIASRADFMKNYGAIMTRPDLHSKG